MSDENNNEGGQVSGGQSGNEMPIGSEAASGDEAGETRVIQEGEFLDPLMEDMNSPNSGRDLDSVYDIPIKVSAILGNVRLKVKDVMRMRKGEVVELDRSVGDAIDIWVNNRLVARGEVVVVEDRLGITMTEIIKTDKAQA